MTRRNDAHASMNAILSEGTDTEHGNLLPQTAFTLKSDTSARLTAVIGTTFMEETDASGTRSLKIRTSAGRILDSDRANDPKNVARYLLLEQRLSEYEPWAKGSDEYQSIYEAWRNEASRSGVEEYCREKIFAHAEALVQHDQRLVNMTLKRSKAADLERLYAWHDGQAAQDPKAKDTVSNQALVKNMIESGTLVSTRASSEVSQDEALRRAADAVTRASAPSSQ